MKERKKERDKSRNHVKKTIQCRGKHKQKIKTDKRHLQRMRERNRETKVEHA